MARRKEATPAQIALAWLLARKPFIVPIPETTKIAHLEEDLGALNVELSAADMQEIQAGIASIKIHGARSSEAVMSLIDDGAKLGTSLKGGHGVSGLRG